MTDDAGDVGVGPVVDTQGYLEGVQGQVGRHPFVRAPVDDQRENNWVTNAVNAIPAEVAM